MSHGELGHRMSHGELGYRMYHGELGESVSWRVRVECLMES